jgi:hypothetical protein
MHQHHMSIHPTCIVTYRPISWQQLPQMNASSTELSQLPTTSNSSFRTCRYIASGRTPRKTPSCIVPYGFRRVNWSVALAGNVFTESLPSSGSIRHSILVSAESSAILCEVLHNFPHSVYKSAGIVPLNGPRHPPNTLHLISYRTVLYIV